MQVPAAPKTRRAWIAAAGMFLVAACGQPSEAPVADTVIDSHASDGTVNGTVNGHLCDPCVDSGQCQLTGHEDARCVGHGAAGFFCGLACNDDADCPSGHRCDGRPTIEGVTSQQCVPTGKGGGVAACGCSERASALALKTPCEAPGADAGGGTCTGFRGCSGGTLSSCQLPPPATEVCDGLDNDCDGESDEGACDDGNACTEDVCDRVTSTCATKASKATLCDADGSPCSVGDTCTGGQCVAGKPMSCDDNEPCTDDVCYANTGCAHTPNEAPCDADGSPCTVGDACVHGACQSGGPKDCADGNLCTIDGCNADGDCLNPPKPGQCDADGSACTSGDSCQAGDCVAGPMLPCDDGNPCTLDGCEAPLGDCLFAALPMEGTACDADGSVCTAGDKCMGAKCTAGGPMVCDDGNICTADDCSPKQGCSHEATAGICDADGTACTKFDSCKAGQCGAGAKVSCDDDNPCTVDSCLPATGACKHAGEALSGTPCDADGSVCTVADTCKAGTCVAGAKKSCDDGSLCTDDDCDAGKGCAHMDNNDGCDSDGNPCTVGDACSSGGCLPGKAKDCDDGSACTDDSCVAATGSCKHAGINHEGKTCDADGSSCTVGDKCTAGKCVAGPGKVCSDGNVCTQDVCDPNSGCAYPPNTAPCDADGSLCTSKDACKGGKCLPGIKLVCKDNKLCTSDACDPKTGCVFPFNKVPCDADGNGCTVGDVCAGGKCKVGLTKTCSDANLCTVDSCHPKTGGCVFDGTAMAGKPCKNGHCQKGKCVVDLGTQANPAVSCLVLLGKRPGLKNKDAAYWIDPDGASVGAPEYRVWCDMTQSGGGWTLLMKTNGGSTTLNYDSPYWSSASLLNANSLNMGVGDAKFRSYVNLPFTEMRLGMQRGSTKRWLQFKYASSSLMNLMKPGFKPVAVSRKSWKSLIGSDASLQLNCNRSGFNNYHAYSRVRIGILANQEPNCGTPDSRLGFGGRGAACGQDNNNTTGNTATCAADNGNKNIKAYGFIFAR